MNRVGIAPAQPSLGAGLVGIFVFLKSLEGVNS